MRVILVALFLLTGNFGGRNDQLVASFLTSSSISSVPFMLSSKRQILYDEQSMSACRIYFDQGTDVIQRVVQPASVFRRKGVDLYAASSDIENIAEFVEAENFEALQRLFSKFCDKEGLITKKAVMMIPAIADLMAAGDLLPEEFSDIWDRAPKFPDTVQAEEKDIERIDVDSFVQVYRDIDDLFESDDESDDQNANSNATKENGQQQPSKQKSEVAAQDDDDFLLLQVSDKDDEVSNGQDLTLDAELESIYETLRDKSGFVSKAQLRKWDEIAKLLEDGLLGEDEFADLWDNTKKASVSGAEEQLDLDGFLSLNVALDDLFAFDDDEMDDVIVPKSAYSMEEDEVKGNSAGPSVQIVQGGDLPADVLFVSLANEDGLVGLDELKRWKELREMIVEGDLLESELMDMFQRVKKSEMDLNKVEEEGFVALYKAIDNLFEEDDSEQPTRQVSRKEEILDAIADLEGDGVLPCGLEATEREQREVLSIIEMVENEPTNLIRSKQGAIAPQELAGTWELLYSSSSAMKFNKGLSGLGGSFPNGRFSNLKQKLIVTKFLTDVEYIERIEVNPSSASFDVTVTGTWDLRTSVSLFTGEPSIVMTVAPDRVTYGPTSTRADHWKSLGPMNMLDITYLDQDLRIMRGNTSVDTIFVFRRIS